MFVGHFGVGLAGKAAAPRVSLATWFCAVQWPDLLWPLFLLLGWEHVRIAPGITRLAPFDFTDYPYSHSLVFDCGWALLFGGLSYVLRARREPDQRQRLRSALLLGGGVLSHWVLDVLVHRPDMPVLPAGPRLGLDLWNHPWIELPLESLFLIAGVVVYLRVTRARDRVGRIAFWALLVFLVVVWILPLYLPPPPDPRSVAWGGLSGWLLVAWAAWADRHREPRERVLALC